MPALTVPDPVGDEQVIAAPEPVDWRYVPVVQGAPVMVVVPAVRLPEAAAWKVGAALAPLLVRT